MTQEDFDKLRSTFPWKHQTVMTPGGWLIRVFDRFGNEVSIVAMVEFIDMITTKIAINKEHAA